MGHRLERDQREGLWNHLPKREATSLKNRLGRLNRDLAGVKGIKSLPGVVVMVGQTSKSTAVQECHKLEIPIIGRLDTDYDPNFAEIGVPINGKSTLRVRMFLETLLPGIQKGRDQWIAKK